MSKPVYDALGLEYTFEVIEDNPLRYMEKYIDSSVMQVANQELQSGQYQVGAIVDDTDGMDFGDEDLFGDVVSDPFGEPMGAPTDY